jgi:ABC-type multidrug transport system fused ATPase/permease subunit
VFDGTIRENLSYALKEEADDEKMIEVLKLAECDFVLEFKKGIDTEI